MTDSGAGDVSSSGSRLSPGTSWEAPPSRGRGAASEAGRLRGVVAVDLAFLAFVSVVTFSAITASIAFITFVASVASVALVALVALAGAAAGFFLSRSAIVVEDVERVCGQSRAQ
jgi:hypothetical protein